MLYQCFETISIATNETGHPESDQWIRDTSGHSTASIATEIFAESYNSVSTRVAEPTIEEESLTVASRTDGKLIFDGVGSLQPGEKAQRL